MKAYRIQNDIVAARDPQEAIAAWAQHWRAPYNSAGPVEQVDPDEVEIQVQEEDESWRPGKLAELMPADGPACVIAFGEHQD